MSPKVRLDLMVSESTKSFLQAFAAEQGVSMSEMVDQLIIEHLMHEPMPAPETSAAVMDMLKIQELQGRLAAAISEGRVWPVSQYASRKEEGSRPDGDAGAKILYVPVRDGNYGVIVCDGLFDELHADVISTYGGDGGASHLDTVDAYLSWYEDVDGRHIDGLCVVPKGADPGSPQGVFDWSAPTTWPEGVPEPWNE